MDIDISPERRDKIAPYATTTGNLRHALRIAYVNPSNTPLIFDLTNSQFEPRPFGAFLFQTHVVVEKILRRNIGIEGTSHIDHDSARSSAFHALDLRSRPAWQSPNKRAESDFYASAQEIALMPLMLSPEEMVFLIDGYARTSYAKEQYDYMKELGDAWRTFRIYAAAQPYFSRLLSQGAFLSRLADEGIEAIIEKEQTTQASKENIAKVMDTHRTVAMEYGVAPRTRQIMAVLEKYKGSMYPVVLPYRRQSPDVVAARRKEFGQSRDGFYGTRAQFLRSLTDPVLRMELYRRGFPLQKFNTMLTRASFGQESNSRNPHIITVEHMAPLTSGDNFIQNFALSTAGANEDTNTLVRLQTDFLPHDRITREAGWTRWDYMAPTVNIVTLRPPFLSYGEGKKFPAFMRHPTWDRNLG